MKVYYDKLQTALEKGLTPLYFINGTPANLVAGAKEMIEEQAVTNGYNIEKYFLDSQFSADAMIFSMDNFGLFDEKRLIELHIHDNKLPKKAVEFIKEFLIKKRDSIVCVIIASSVKNSDIPQSLIKIMDSKGTIITAYELKHWQIPQWLADRAKKLKVNLSQEAQAKIIKLMYESTESGHQILQRLSIEYGSNLINDDDVNASLSDSTQGTIFDMVYYTLEGELSRATELFQQIRRANIEFTILLWHISTELHNLVVMAQAIENGSTLSDVAKTINPLKKQSYLKTLKRLSLPKLIALLIRLPYIDNLNKGLQQGDPWQELEQIIFSLCDHQTMPSYIKIKQPSS